MVYVTTITDVLNTWSEYGVFSYLLPFLLVFAVVFGILNKSGIFGRNRGVDATIAFAVGLLSLQFDYVSDFFSTIFPFAGIGLSVLLVAVILLGLFHNDEDSTFKWIFGILGGIIFLIVAFSSVNQLDWIIGYGDFDAGSLIGIIFAVAILGLIGWIIFKGGDEGSSNTRN